MNYVKAMINQIRNEVAPSQGVKRVKAPDRAKKIYEIYFKDFCSMKSREVENGDDLR